MENEKRGCNLEPPGNGEKIRACSSTPPAPNRTRLSSLGQGNCGLAECHHCVAGNPPRMLWAVRDVCARSWPGLL